MHFRIEAADPLRCFVFFCVQARGSAQSGHTDHTDKES